MKEHISRTFTTQERYPLGKVPKSVFKRPKGWKLGSTQRKVIKKVAKKRDRKYFHREDADDLYSR